MESEGAQENLVTPDSNISVINKSNN